MKQEEAVKALKKNTRVWMEGECPPYVMTGKLVKKYSDGFFLFRSDSGIIDYMPHCGQVYFVPVKPEQSWFGKILRVIFSLRFLQKRVN